MVLVVLRGKGKGSGAEVATPAAHVWTMRRGKAIRVAAYMDRAKALEAAGLSKAALDEKQPRLIGLTKPPAPSWWPR